MYSLLRNVQIVVASLKSYGVRHVVHCPGGADAPIGESFDNDDSFACYSIVDERSAVFFAIGVSMANGNVPVAVVCTSGTAVSNFTSGMTEAYYKGIPIIAITADRSPYTLDQFEIQKIDQRAIFSNCTKAEIDLPIVSNEDEAWYCDRLVNEALLELDSGIPGPIHINVPTTAQGPSGCYAASLPPVKTMRRHMPGGDWRSLAEELSDSKRVLVIVGENARLSEKDKDAMGFFFDRCDCVYSVEHMSNYRGKGSVVTYRATEAITSKAFESLAPSLVIDFGGHIASVNLKRYLRERSKSFKHWSIREDGTIRDGYRSLTDVFQCTPGYFFDFFAQALKGSINNEGYYKQWRNAVDAIEPPCESLSNFRVAKELAELIPEGSLLELGILNSVRVMQFFDLDESVKVSANLGALGIDGCLSTAVGKAASTDRLVVIMQGDLSFFYDMNALNIRYVGSNLRVLLVNNGGAAEFHIGGGRKVHPNIDEYLAAQHSASARGWAEECGFTYLCVRAVEDLHGCMERFVSPSEKPILMEVFTDRDNDAALLDSFYGEHSGATSTDRMKGAAKSTAKRLLALTRN